MTKKELIKALADRTSMTALTVDKLLAELSKLSAEQLAKNGELTIPGIVAMKSRFYQARPARNPRTGEPCVIPAGQRVRVKPVTAFMEQFSSAVTA